MGKRIEQVEGQMSFLPLIMKEGEKVYMHNEFVAGWQDTSLYSTKIIRLMAALVQKNDNEFLEYGIGVRGLAKELNTSPSAISNNKEKITYELSHRVLGIREKDGSISWIPYMAKAKWDRTEEKFFFRLNKELAPYLLGLTGNFMCYDNELAMKFRTTEGLHIYELLLAKCNKKSFPRDEVTKIPLSVSDIRFCLAMDQYDMENGNLTPGKYFDDNGKLVAYVIRPAVSDIEKTVTDFHLSFKSHANDEKEGVGRKKHTEYEFTITPKDMMVVGDCTFRECRPTQCIEEKPPVEDAKAKSKTKEKGGSRGVRKNSFNDFRQNEYDMEELERLLVVNKPQKAEGGENGVSNA